MHVDKKLALEKGKVSNMSQMTDKFNTSRWDQQGFIHNFHFILHLLKYKKETKNFY